MTMTKRHYPRVSLPALPWASQHKQYPPEQSPGFHVQIERLEGWERYEIRCLLLYDMDRQLVGILNTYPDGFPGLEVPRAINIWVDPKRQRRGLGTRLLREAERLWGPIDWDAQRFTVAGQALAESYRED